MVRLALSAVLVAVTASGCSETFVGTDGHTYAPTSPKYVVDKIGIYNSAAYNALRASAAHDIPCPLGQVGRPTPYARGLWRVEGCGARMTYFVGSEVWLVDAVSNAE